MNTRLQFCFCLVTTLLVIPMRLPGDEHPQAAPSPPDRGLVAPETVHLPEVALPNVPGEPSRTKRRIGLGGLGLMAGLLGVIWSRHHHGQRRRRRGNRAAWGWREPPGRTPDHPSRRTAARQRIRRFDYDRFYLRMLRDL
jgi:hypothetical protein